MRSEDVRWWSETARDDWRVFETLKREDHYAAAVFHLQQACEKMLKALCYLHGRPTFTHSTLEILQKLEQIGVELTEDLKACARRLDPHYVTTRYPNTVGGVPRDYYDLKLIEELESCARMMMSFAESKLSEGTG